MAVAGDPFLAPRCNTDLILAAIRRQLFHHRGAGRQNVVAFQEAFTACDGDGDRRLTHFEFEKALGRCGVFLPSQEINALFRRFDTKGEARADTEQILSALRAPLNKRRLAVVDAAFFSAAATDDTNNSTDGINTPTGATNNATDGGLTDGGGRGREEATLSLSVALGCLRPGGHPEVAAGRLEAREVEDDFIAFFSSNRLVSSTAGNSGGGKVSFTLKEFREYYRDVGICEPYDSVFIPMVEGLWGVREPHPDEDEGSELVRLLRPKLLQRSHNSETTAEVFRKTLRYYGLSAGSGAKHGGMVDASGLERALNSFGLYPERREIEGIFTAAGSSSSAEPQEVDTIAALLCPQEPAMAPMF